MNFIPINESEKLKNIINDALSENNYILHSHSLLYIYGSLNAGATRLYVNEDYDYGNIIIAQKKFKNNPIFTFISPKCDIEYLMKSKKILESTSNRRIVINDVSDGYCSKFLQNCSNKGIKGWKKKFKYYEIIYDTKICKELKGKSFKKIRSNKNRFYNKYNPKIHIMNKNNLIDALKVMENWKYEFKEKYPMMFAGREINMLKKYCKEVDEENIFGYIFYVKGQPKGIVFGCRSIINDKYGFFHIGKGSDKIHGLNEFGNHYLFSKMYDAGIRYSNDGATLTSGLRNYKEKWKPVKTVNSFSLEQENIYAGELREVEL